MVKRMLHNGIRLTAEYQARPLIPDAMAWKNDSWYKWRRPFRGAKGHNVVFRSAKEREEEALMLHRCLCLALLLCPALAQAEEPFRYPEGKHGKGELRYVNGLPVLSVRGTPEEIGEQAAILGGKSARKLFNYPRDVMREFSAGLAWPIVLQIGKTLVPQFPDDQRRELDSFAKQGFDRDNLIAANTMFDAVKLIACSSVIVEKDRSATGVPLFGRNLDYPTAGYLQDYSMVIVYHPEGKHAFASVGFPGLIGCLSGINDAGLSLCILEVLDANDGSPKFDRKGTPYAMNYRRILEECTTIEEAEKLLRTMKRTTRNNLAVCDKTGAAVFEITPKSVVVRHGDNGCCLCTNHFCTKELAPAQVENRVFTCDRFRILKEQSEQLPKIGATDVWHMLHAVNGGSMTLQTMIFEPTKLHLYLAIGAAPSSAREPKALDLRPLLQEASASPNQGR